MMYKMKHASMEIYRPPSLRSSDGIHSGSSGSKLNVNAKEFVISNSSSPANSFKDNYIKSDMEFDNEFSLTLAKSKSTDVFNLKSNLYKSKTADVFNFIKSNSSQFKTGGNQKFVPYSANTNQWPVRSLQRTKSSNVLVENNNKVQFRIPSVDRSEKKTNGKTSPTGRNQLLGSLKRSKSLSAANALQFMALEASSSSSSTFTEYHLFPAKFQNRIRQSIENADKQDDKNKIILGRKVVEYASNDKKLALPAAKLSIFIIDKDESCSYLDSLLNTCQMLYQTRSTGALADSTSLMAFFSFILNMYTEIKSSKLQLKLQSDSASPPKTVFLLLIARCCEDILTESEIHSVPEAESVFLALKSMGRDLEHQVPHTFSKLLNIIRQLLLKGKNEAKVQKMYLQLIELRAANWQLPISALNYYYTNTSSI